MSTLAREIAEYYAQGREPQRLSPGGPGELERVRTLTILARHLPPPPAVVVDVGGGAGVYAFPLAEAGYRVHLMDPVDVHLAEARRRVAESGVSLASIASGDARKLGLADAMADAVLLLGPMYHLTEQSDRVQALREARRIVRPGGVVLAAAISRFASLIDGVARGYFCDPNFREIAAQDLLTGQHRNPTQQAGYFTTAYFHAPAELADECRDAGLVDYEAVTVEGPVWGAAAFGQVWTDPAARERLLELLASIEREPSILGASGHFLGIARRPE